MCVPCTFVYVIVTEEATSSPALARLLHRGSAIFHHCPSGALCF